MLDPTHAEMLACGGRNSGHKLEAHCRCFFQGKFTFIDYMSQNNHDHNHAHFQGHRHDHLHGQGYCHILFIIMVIYYNPPPSHPINPRHQVIQN